MVPSTGLAMLASATAMAWILELRSESDSLRTRWGLRAGFSAALVVTAGLAALWAISGQGVVLLVNLPAVPIVVAIVGIAGVVTGWHWAAPAAAGILTLDLLPTWCPAWNRYQTEWPWSLSVRILLALTITAAVFVAAPARQVRPDRPQAWRLGGTVVVGVACLFYGVCWQSWAGVAPLGPSALTSAFVLVPTAAVWLSRGSVLDQRPLVLSVRRFALAAAGLALALAFFLSNVYGGQWDIAAVVAVAGALALAWLAVAADPGRDEDAHRPSAARTVLRRAALGLSAGPGLALILGTVEGSRYSDMNWWVLWVPVLLTPAAGGLLLVATIAIAGEQTTTLGGEHAH